MKKGILLSTFLLLLAFGTKAQPPFQFNFDNLMGYSCDHYSIETFEEDGMEQKYAVAGTFFNGTQTIMHIFTLDIFGNLVWENYINLGSDDGRALDVAVGPDFSVAITGFVNYGSGPQLYAAWYDAGGSLINDFLFNGATTSTGSNIIYSRTNDQFIIGGFESAPFNFPGNALMIALDGGFNLQWSNTFNAQCDGFDMAVINEIVEVNEHYFITGNLSDPSSAIYGQSQVLAAMVESGSGALLSNDSFVATNTLGGQQAMGVSAHFDEGAQRLVLMYNVSVSPTTDENRPHFNIYDVSGVDLNYVNGYRFDDLFVTHPSVFTINPNFTGLKLLRNRENDTYIVFGMIEAYSQPDTRVLSVYQEVDLNSGVVFANAKTWSQSEIPSLYPQGNFYSLFDPFILNTKVYSPETTTLSFEGGNFVSVLPVPGTTISYDVISSTLNTAAASSPCIEEFKLELVDHEIFDFLCLEEVAPIATDSVPLHGESPFNSVQDNNCDISMAPLAGNEEYTEEMAVQNDLTIFGSPADDLLRYTITESGKYDVFVMSIEGQVLITNRVQNNNGEQQLNIKDLASGIYVLVAVDANGDKIQKRFAKK